MPTELINDRQTARPMMQQFNGPGRFVWLLLGCLLFLNACHTQPEPHRQEAYVFGTRVELTIYDKSTEKAQQAAAKVLADLDRLHGKLHTWQPDSTLYKLNQALAKGKTVTLDAELAGLIRQGQRFSGWSDGLFNPALGQLVALWGFHADRYAAKLPDQQALMRLINAKPSMSDLRWQGEQLTSTNPTVALDFGGMAKGWALDRARRILQENGIQSALVNIGGNVIALGKRPDGSAWRVGIQHPQRDEAMAGIELADGEAIGTSGNYRRNFTVDGRQHCHLIDPRDGNSDCRKQAITILMPPSPEAGVRSDVASKPFYFAPLSDAARYMQRFQTPYVLIVDGQGVAWVSPALAKRLSWLDNAPQHQLLKVN